MLFSCDYFFDFWLVFRRRNRVAAISKSNTGIAISMEMSVSFCEEGVLVCGAGYTK